MPPSAVFGPKVDVVPHRINSGQISTHFVALLLCSLKVPFLRKSQVQLHRTHRPDAPLGLLDRARHASTDGWRPSLKPKVYVLSHAQPDEQHEPGRMQQSDEGERRWRTPDWAAPPTLRHFQPYRTVSCKQLHPEPVRAHRRLLRMRLRSATARHELGRLDSGSMRPLHRSAPRCWPHRRRCRGWLDVGKNRPDVAVAVRVRPRHKRARTRAQGLKPRCMGRCGAVAPRRGQEPATGAGTHAPGRRGGAARAQPPHRTPLGGVQCGKASGPRRLGASIPKDMLVPRQGKGG